MQAVIVCCELAKLNYGMSARWLVANWESDGMFYNGTASGIPLWNPRPDVFYMHFARQSMGDHLVSASVPGSQVVLAYASTFASGHVGIIVVNKSKTAFTASLTPDNYSFGDRFYVYSLTGGTDNGDFSQIVNVNDEGPSAPAWGPSIDQLDSLKAYAYPTTGNEIKFPLPGRSVQFILLEPGSHSTSVENRSMIDGVRHFELFQNFPNPFNPTTVIQYAVPAGRSRQVGTVSLRVYDILGREVATLVNEVQQPGYHSVHFNAIDLPSGVYFYRLETESFAATKMMLLLR
jgi:hypothetical protein